MKRPSTSSAKALPSDLEANLPSIEQIERELGDTDE
jgi:hypothetical protein